MSDAALARAQVEAFERCIEGGGVALFPTDTVYGLACSPDSAGAIARMYELKGRDSDAPSAIMFFDLEAALQALSGLGDFIEAALRRLLPGPVMVVLPNPAGRFPLATGPRGLGVRVPKLDGALEPLAAARTAVLQTSANLSGSRDPRQVADIPEPIRLGVDFVLDAGPLLGVPSTVVDLGEYEASGRWQVLREAAVPRERIEATLSALQ